jgi:hypothetical protein
MAIGFLTRGIRSPTVPKFGLAVVARASKLFGPRHEFWVIQKTKEFPLPPMDSSIIAAISAILGTTVGGLSTFATTLLNQRYAMARDVLAKDVANREQLYSEFLKEVGNLYFDSINRTIDDVSQQASLIAMYALVGRIRMISSEAVLKAAEKVAEDIVESYKRPPTTFQEFQQLWGTSDPWHEFTDACRAERQSMLGRL